MFSSSNRSDRSSNDVATGLSRSRNNGVGVCCRFHFLQGHCRYGDNCRFLHVIPDHLTYEEAMKQIPCPYHQRGICRYGEYCQLSHDYENESSFYTDEAGNCCNIPETSGLGVCVPAKAASAESASTVCGVCLEDVAVAGNSKRFGLLSHCDHCFCLDCVMQWRQTTTSEKDVTRCCPTCRVKSDFVVPSSKFVIGKAKEDVIASYKSHLSIIPCKHFTVGELGSCPFGKDCFYAHSDHDGSDMKQLDLSMKDLSYKRKRRSNYSNQNHHHNRYYRGSNTIRWSSLGSYNDDDYEDNAFEDFDEDYLFHHNYQETQRTSNVQEDEEALEIEALNMLFWACLYDSLLNIDEAEDNNSNSDRDQPSRRGARNRNRNRNRSRRGQRVSSSQRGNFDANEQEILSQAFMAAWEDHASES